MLEEITLYEDHPAMFRSHLQRSAGSGEAEIVVAGMRDPENVKAILDAGRREKRTDE